MFFYEVFILSYFEMTLTYTTQGFYLNKYDSFFSSEFLHGGCQLVHGSHLVHDRSSETEESIEPESDASFFE